VFLRAGTGQLFLFVVAPTAHSLARANDTSLSEATSFL
jgi:hypothetical protein